MQRGVVDLRLHRRESAQNACTVLPRREGGFSVISRSFPVITLIRGPGRANICRVKRAGKTHTQTPPCSLWRAREQDASHTQSLGGPAQAESNCQQRAVSIESPKKHNEGVNPPGSSSMVVRASHPPPAAPSNRRPPLTDAAPTKSRIRG